jgi:hypothetical protein
LKNNMEKEYTTIITDDERDYDAELKDLELES